MYRLPLLMLLAFLLVMPAWSQDEKSGEPDETPTAASDPAAADDVTDEEIDELLGLGDDDYTELEDDFDPTEEVRFEQSIPFPTDI